MTFPQIRYQPRTPRLLRVRSPFPDVSYRLPVSLLRETPIFVDDSMEPISGADKLLIAELADEYFRYRKYEYAVTLSKSGKIETCTDRDRSACTVNVKGPVDIYLHNHPGGLASPSLQDRLMVRDYVKPRIAGVYGRNEVKNRLQVTIFHTSREESHLEEPDCQIISPAYFSMLPWFNIPVPDFSFAFEPEARERKIDLVLEKLKQGVESIQNSENFRQWLETLAKFHEYSIGNQILIWLQRHNATRVAGFNTWKSLGRYVRAGEHGIDILAPCLPPKGLTEEVWKNGKEWVLRGRFVYEVTPAKGVALAEKFATREEAIGWLVRQGAHKVEEAEVSMMPQYFKVVSVFDVSQTEGKELPEIAVPALTGNVNTELVERVLALAESEKVPVSFEPKPLQDPEIKGTFSHMDKGIWVKPTEPPAQQLKTLIHELAHYYSESVFGIPRADAETIAESSAFAVAAHFGFDTGTRSFPYVAAWARDKKVLEQNMAAIRKVSDRMIHALEAVKLSELQVA